jgi:hypothetical protein
MILELKIDHTPDDAIAQIKDKKYALRFAPKIAGNREYTGRILAVGIFVDGAREITIFNIKQLVFL